MRKLMHAATAIAITLALFWGMVQMISGDGDVAAHSPPPTPVEIVRVKRDETPPETKPNPPDQPERRQQPPRPPEEVPPVGPPDSTVVIGPPSKGATTEGRKVSFSNDATPVNPLPPQYPGDALARGIEGYVRLEFTVLENGSVANARVIDASPRGVFETAALQALNRWRFRPQMVDGSPVASVSRYTMDFRIVD